MTRILVLAAVAAAIGTASFLAACGGSDDPEPVSKEELVSRADAACVAEQKAFADIQTDSGAGASELADQTHDLADALGDELDELRGMEPPAPQQKTYARYLASLGDAKEALERGADAAEGQDSRSYGKLQSQVAKGKIERRRLAAALGFRKCSPLTAP